MTWIFYGLAFVWSICLISLCDALYRWHLSCRRQSELNRDYTTLKRKHKLRRYKTKSDLERMFAEGDRNRAIDMRRRELGNNRREEDDYYDDNYNIF
jgi:hypothetical protein